MKITIITNFKGNVNLSKSVENDRVFHGLAVPLLGISSGFALGKSIGAALPALGRPDPSLLFYSDSPSRSDNKASSGAGSHSLLSGFLHLLYTIT